ncbi:MAG: response regulator [Firmicutes bacterium]|nr:response regulator [Bacillota bacterium]
MLLFLLYTVHLDVLWVLTGGSKGTPGFYYVVASLYLLVFTRGSMRAFMVVLYLVNGCAMVMLEHVFPGWVWSLPPHYLRWVDILVAFVCNSVILFSMLWFFLDAYEREQHRLTGTLETLQASERQTSLLMEHAPAAIAILSETNKAHYVNRAFERQLGYSLQEVHDVEAWWKLAYPDPVERYQIREYWFAAMRKAIEDGSGIIPPKERKLYCKNGQYGFFQVQATRIGTDWMVVFTDVTELRRHQDALRQTQKLESLGILAGGIAHDFNNLLGAMMGNVNLAQMSLPDGCSAGPYLENLEATLLRAANLTRQMLAYSGQGRFVVEPLDLNKLVRDITHLLSVSISKQVRLELDLAASLPRIEADHAQVQQVAMNLVTNASEAMQGGDGVIGLRTYSCELKPEDLTTRLAGQDLVPGQYVVLEVSDDGIGMDEGTMARIFDPFFSTKGSGRGLGLSAMLGILNGHKAGIAIRSRLGEGSCFQIFLRASEKAGDVAVEENPKEVCASFRGKVLLVDDEVALRETYRTILERMGMEVVEAVDGMDAMHKYQPGEFALVLMDLTMPRLDGRAAFLSMRMQDPDVKVVLMSGYSSGGREEDVIDVMPAAFIQKPFRVPELASVLTTVLGPKRR